MRLRKLLEQVEICEVFENEDINVLGVSDDSRKVKNGFLFVAISGFTLDAHKFIPQAIESGAIAIIGEKKPKKHWLEKITYVRVKNSREALAAVASAWHGNPSKRLKMIGVTGTDGKTTTASMIYEILKASNKEVGLITSVSAKIGEDEFDTGFHITSPEPLELHKFLKMMVDKGCKYGVLEVTSIGLDQKRFFGIDFDISVLTNITHEHMLYHKTMENYSETKAELINNSKSAFINKRYYQKVEKYIKPDVKVNLFDGDSIEGNIRKTVNKRFPEDFNRLNTTASILVARSFGVGEKVIERAIKEFKLPRGRLEKVENNKGFDVYIDFAHTPNALRNVLKALRRKIKGRLICVFGCASERDDEKRPIMGEISIRLSDISVFTSEDPRYENPNEIIKQIETGAKKAGGRKDKDYFIRAERGEAIWFAINKLAKKGDVVVICGKGHEKSMNYKGFEYPWSDHGAVSEVLQGRRKGIPYLKDKKTAVLGLGVEGRDLVKYLLSKEARVTIFDQKDKKELDLSGFDLKRVKFVTGRDYLKHGLEDFDVVFRSPGVYRFRKEINRAERSGVEISSAIKLFMELCPGRVIGVTGTKGKGTTSTLIYEVLKEAGKDVYLAGNIGVPYLELLDKLNKDSWVVLELSSFQLIDLTKSPQVAVVLNVTADHLDWHKDLEEYIDAKKNIVRHQNKEDFAVLNGDYKISKSFAKETEEKVYFFRKIDVSGQLNPNKLLLRGKHNWENVAAAMGVAKVLGIRKSLVKKVVYNFNGLEHRLELVGEYKGVAFYNDSFSTNPEPAIAAIKSFKEPITIILGGYDKGLDYNNLGLVVSKRKNVGCVVLIGQTAKKIERVLRKVNYKGKLISLGKPKMRELVKAAFENTPKGGIVLLSPASASFDMFENYKERGKKFKESVKTIFKK